MDDRERRIRAMLEAMFGMSETARGSTYGRDDLLAPKPSEHSLAAETILATSEVMAALARNGVKPAEIRDKVFGVLVKMAKPFPGLHNLVKDWLKDGMENSRRLEELRDYNSLLSGGAAGDEQ